MITVNYFANLFNLYDLQTQNSTFGGNGDEENMEVQNRSYGCNGAASWYTIDGAGFAPSGDTGSHCFCNEGGN
ncbi:MAG: hypothetical protein ACI9XO_003750 [Paraglaciecola sp.]|jgi:hypothetical protein